MKFSGIWRAGLALTGLCLLSVGGWAQEANPTPQSAATQTLTQTAATNEQYARSIVTRAGSVNEKAKTFRMEGTLDVAAGNMGAASFQMLLYTSGDKSRMEMNPIGQGVGEIGKQMAAQRTVEVFDGKMTTTLSNGMYSRKRGHEEEKDAEDGPFSLLSDADSSHYELLPAVTLEGHPVFVIRLTPREKQEGDPAMSMTLFIDQESYQPRKMEIVAIGDEPDQQLNITLNFNKVAVNSALSADLFKLTIPKGAKEAPATQESIVSGGNPIAFAMAGLSACKPAKAK